MKKYIYSLIVLCSFSLVAKSQDTMRFNLGNKAVTVIARDIEETSDTTSNDSIPSFNSCGAKSDKNNIAHFAGIELSYNGFFNSDMKTDLKDNPFELEASKSIGVNLNFAESKLSFGKSNVGLVTGFGFSFNSYGFNKNNILTTTSDTTMMIPAADGINFKKNKLNIAYLTIPLMLEFNTSKNESESAYISVGVEGGVRLYEKYKQKYSANGDDVSNKNRDDYNANFLKADAVVRVGYKSLDLFAKYPLNPLFEKGKAEELSAFQIGIVLADF